MAATLTADAAASLSPTLSYRVYTLGLSDLVSDTGNLSAASSTIWRHSFDSDGEIVTADVLVDQTGAGYTFAALSSNPSASEVQSTINALNQDPQIAEASYEVSLLQVPALAVRAVWLHEPSGKSADLLVPISPVRSELTAGQRYQIMQFTGALKEAAAAILANDDPNKGSA